MRTFISAMLLLAWGATAATAQTQHYWILLRPKDVSSSLQKYTQPPGVTERALKRRAKSLAPDRLIDDLDFPISESDLTQIQRTGVKIRTVSRWFNAVSVEASPQQLHLLNALPVVSRSEPVVQFKRSRPQPASVPPKAFMKSPSTQGVDYGLSETQLTNMNVLSLHRIGVNGAGVLIGMIDDGFNNYQTHTALKNIRIIATHDFIHNIDDVSLQPWEVKTSPNQGNHGAGTLSAIGGFDNGQLIGAAYGASFLLAKTEMDSSGNSADFNSEEDTFIAGLEWAERLGADITSSSLGYKQFLSIPTYTSVDMNGRTTKVARAALIAARKGVLVVTAMGNDGNSSGTATTTLDSPADADSIVSVGATVSDGELAGFSSCGPTADGRTKPEVVAQGAGIYWANGSTPTGYTVSSGTSCSTPLVAGAAALILSAHPQLTNMQVRDALMSTTTQRKDKSPMTAKYPNNYYGNGFVDAFAAALYYGPVFSNTPQIVKTTAGFIITTMIASKYKLYPDSILYYYRYDTLSSYSHAVLTPTSNPDEYSTTIPPSPNGSLPTGYFSARQEIGGIPSQLALFQNYPNPFNDATTIMMDAPVKEEVEVTVFNILGQRVKIIYHGQSVAGINIFHWDGTDDQARRVATGVYVTRLRTPQAIRSIKMLYLK